MILPPIKRLRILVSGGVGIVISVKLYNKIGGSDACGCAYPAGKFPCAGILQPKAKSGPVRSQQHQPPSSGFSTSRTFSSQLVRVACKISFPAKVLRRLVRQDPLPDACLIRSSAGCLAGAHKYGVSMH
jgi:hypothetical protein